MEMLRRAAERAEAESIGSETETAGGGQNEKQDEEVPNLILHSEPGCAFEDITLDDFEMVNYSPMKPQLKFELGI
jgi:thymidylate synthase